MWQQVTQGLSRFVRRWPFLSVGLLTLGLFVLVEALPQGARDHTAGQALVATIRVLMVPLWLMRTLEMLIGIGWWPAPLQFLVALPLLFMPYLAADVLLERACRRRGEHRTATEKGGSLT